MSTVQKTALSLLLAVLVFTGFAVAAYSGLFDYIEATFYDPRVRAGVDDTLELASEITEAYHDAARERFSASLNEPAVQNVFRVNQSREDILWRETYFGELGERMPSFSFARFADIEGERLWYSSWSEDVVREDATTRVYRPVAEIDEGIPVTPFLLSPGTRERDLVTHPPSNHFIYRFTATDGFDIPRGTALFYVTPLGLRNALIRGAVIGSGNIVRLVEQGLILNATATNADLIAEQLSASWPQVIADGEPPLALELGEDLRRLAFTRKLGEAYLVLLVDETDFAMTTPMRVVLLIASFLTTFLVAFLLLNLRQDAVVVMSERVKRFQVNFLREYMESKEELDWDRWRRELESRREEVRRELKRGVRGAKGAKGKELDDLFDKSWDEILNVIAGRRQIGRGGDGIDLDRLESIIERMVSNLSTPGMAGGTSATETPDPTASVARDGAVQHGAATALPENMQKVRGTQQDESIVEPAEAEELEEVEELDDAEELDELEELEERDATEEVAEVEQVKAADADDGEDFEELEELNEEEEPASEPDKAEPAAEGDTQATGDTDAPAEDGTAVETVELQEPGDLETADELEELEEVDEPEDAVAVAAEAVEADDQQDLEELAELEDAEEAEELEELGELEEAAEEGVLEDAVASVPAPAHGESEGAFSAFRKGDATSHQPRYGIEETEDGGDVLQASLAEELVPEPDSAESEIDDTWFHSQTAGLQVGDVEGLDGEEMNAGEQAEDLDVWNQLAEVQEEWEAPSASDVSPSVSSDDAVEMTVPVENGAGMESHSADGAADATDADLEELPSLESADESQTEGELEPAEDTDSVYGGFTFGLFEFGGPRADSPDGDEEIIELEEAEEPVELEELDEAEDLEEVDDPAEVGLDDTDTARISARANRPASHGLIRFDVEGTSNDYEVISIQRVLDQVAVETPVIEEADGVVQISGHAYEQKHEPDGEPLKGLVETISAEDQGETLTARELGIDDILSGTGGLELYSIGQRIESPSDADKGRRGQSPETDVKRMLISERGLDYDEFLSGFKKNEGGLFKSLIEFTRIWNAKFSAILVQKDEGYQVEYMLGLEEPCLSFTRITGSDLLYRNVLAQRSIVILKRPLDHYEDLRVNCSESELAYIGHAVFIPVVFRGKDAYLLLGLGDTPVHGDGFIAALLDHAFRMVSVHPGG